MSLSNLKPDIYNGTNKVLVDLGFEEIDGGDMTDDSIGSVYKHKENGFIVKVLMYGTEE